MSADYSILWLMFKIFVEQRYFRFEFLTGVNITIIISLAIKPHRFDRCIPALCCIPFWLADGGCMWQKVVLILTALRNSTVSL
jgi:hypothetical protein